MERGAGCPRASYHPTGTPRRTWESFWTRSSCPGNPGPPGPEDLEDFETPGYSCWNPAPDSVGSRGSQGSASDGDRARGPRPYPPESPRRAGLAWAWLPVSWRSVGPEGPGSTGWPDVPSFSWPWTGKPGPVFGTGHRSNPNPGRRSSRQSSAPEPTGPAPAWFRGRLATPPGKPRISLRAYQRQGILPKRLLSFPRARKFRTPCSHAGLAPTVQESGPRRESTGPRAR